MTRLLKRPIAGPSAAQVTSSCSDRLAGLSKWYILSTPPGFCANAGSPATSASSSAALAASVESFRVICVSLCGRLFVEPDVLHAPAVEQAVHHDRQALDLRQRAGRSAGVKNDRTDHFLGQHSFDLPNQLTTLWHVRFNRLPIDQFVKFRITIPGVITLSATHVIFIVHLVGVVERGLGDRKADGIVLADHLGKPIGRLDRLELAINIDLL